MMRDPIPETAGPGVVGASAAAGSAWRIAAVALALTLAWILVWYRGTGTAMAGIWARSDTFAHGWFVAPIALWLVWRARAKLLQVAPRPSVWLLAPILAAGFGWLAGELAAVNAVSQLALVALLVLAVPAVLGWRAARTITFPLVFLVFAVPIGEFAMPTLMEWTADFTVLALRLTGIPVFREGQNMVIPSGNWSVVEACSGVRYLIASLVVGTLYAYLNYRSPLRRAVFIGFSILVPIVANWLRAYIIVMLGHLSGNKLAVGVDHLIYGWLFFGVVILAMFWIGARWREDDDGAGVRELGVGAQSGGAIVGARGGTGGAMAASPASFALIAIAVAVATVVWPLAYSAIERADAAPAAQLTDIPGSGAWHASPGGLADWQPRFLGPSAELNETFRRDGEAVGVYVGYYRDQSYERKLVSSENVLVTTKDPMWTRVGGGSRNVTLGDSTFAAATAELRGVGDTRLVVWHWYWIDGRLTASQAWAKAYTALSRLMGRGDDGAAIVVYTTKGGPGAAEATLERFVRDVGPQILSTLEQTRGRR